jgi:hypothetical protein
LRCSKKKQKGDGSVVAIAFFGAPLQPKNKKEGAATAVAFFGSL